MITLLDILMIIAISILILAGALGFVLTCAGTWNLHRPGEVDHFHVRDGQLLGLPDPSTPLDVLGQENHR